MKTNSIIISEITPEALKELINEGIKNQLENFKKDLQIQNNDELLSREQTCKFLQIDSSTCYHWTNKGKITAYGIGNRRYYKKAELLKCLIQLKK